MYRNNDNMDWFNMNPGIPAFFKSTYKRHREQDVMSSPSTPIRQENRKRTYETFCAGVNTEDDTRVTRNPET